MERRIRQQSKEKNYNLRAKRVKKHLCLTSFNPRAILDGNIRCQNHRHQFEPREIRELDRHIHSAKLPVMVIMNPYHHLYHSLPPLLPP